MGWRSLFLTNQEHLDISIDNKRLAIRKNSEKAAHFRVEDINFILIDSYNFKISGKALEVIAKKNIPLVVTSTSDHMPVLQLSNPYSSHHQMGAIVSHQSKLTKKIKLALWQGIIYYKISSQGFLINEFEQAEKMSTQALKTKSATSLLGVEGSWAKFYWKRLVNDENFSRVPKVYGNPNDTMNSFLNYAYAILRARIASAIAENGMLPLFSIFHRRDYNPFALADDLIEPYRWCADKIFKENIEEISASDDFALTPALKKLALSTLHQQVFIPSLQRSYVLDEAIRIGVRSFKVAMLTDAAQLFEEMLCIPPQ